MTLEHRQLDTRLSFFSSRGEAPVRAQTQEVSVTTSPPEEPTSAWRRAERFFTVEVWQTDPERLSRPRAIGTQAARVLYAGVRTFLERDLPTRAAALTYYTVLSLVPFLAFAFSMVKGLGAYTLLVDEILLPRLHATFAGNAQLLEAIDKVFAFVDATNVASLGAVGAGMLMYTSVGLMQNIASGLNAVWGAPGRPLLRAVRDFIAIIVLAPLTLTIAGGLIAAATASTASTATYVREALGLGVVIDVVMSLAPVAVAFLGLLFLYLVLPSVKVRLRSAAVGAIVGALLWYGALLLYVQLQIGVAGYNALYAGFAVLPVFLLWIYVSWLIVLIGGGVAAGHQNTRLLVQQMRARGADERFLEALAVNVMALVGRSFLREEPRWTREALGATLDVSDELVGKVLDGLVASGLVVKTDDDGKTSWVLARDPELIRVRDILGAIGHQPSTARSAVKLEEAIDPRVRALVASLEEDVARSPNNLGLRELVSRLD